MQRLLPGLRFRRDHRWVPSRASAYLDHELERGRRRRVERHTADCPECRELLRSLRTLIEALAGLRGDQERPVADAVLVSLRSRLGELERDRP